MPPFLIRRFAGMVPVWLGCAVLVFLLMRLVPGDPALLLAGPGAQAGDVAAVRAELGLDRPLPAQLAAWIAGLLTGNWGHSYSLRAAVFPVLLERLAPTLEVAVLATGVSVLLGLPLGAVAAARRGPVDWAATTAAAAGLSVPSFLMGILLVYLLAFYVPVLPIRGYVRLAEDPVQWARYLVLPVLTFGFIQSAIVARMTRASLLEVLRSDFVRTARAKGLAERGVVVDHALRNALLPVVTVIGLNLGSLLASAVAVETVFGIPGLGALLVKAITSRDYPLVQGGVMFVVTGFLLVNFAVDVLYGVLDPRVRRGA